jgi:hypothetical protein
MAWSAISARATERKQAAREEGHDLVEVVVWLSNGREIGEVEGLSVCDEGLATVETLTQTWHVRERDVIAIGIR